MKKTTGTDVVTTEEYEASFQHCPIQEAKGVPALTSGASMISIKDHLASEWWEKRSDSYRWYPELEDEQSSL